MDQTKTTGFLNPIVRECVKAAILYAAVAAVILIVFNFIIMLCLVPSESMEGTLMVGDVYIGTRFDREDVNRYDVITFIRSDKPGSFFVKRGIGLPGETIVVENGEVYADGVKLDRSFVPERQTTMGDGTYVVPEGCYFMMGIFVMVKINQ